MAMRVIVDSETGEIDWNTVSFHNECVSVSDNYVYESPELLNDKRYQLLYNITHRLDNSVHNSHDVVAFWMIHMNRVCGERMAERNCGIFRSMRIVDKVRANSAPVFLNEETRRCIQHWNNTSGEYCTADSNTGHDMMHIGAYTHITSPIRRLVDLLNQMTFLEEAGLVDSISDDARAFRAKWVAKLDCINTAMRAIRKVQTDCDMLALCVESPHILDSTHRGVVFDRADNGDGSYSYMVFLEDIRLLSRIKCSGEDPLDNYSMHEFRIHLFHDEHTLNRKVRVSLYINE